MTTHDTTGLRRGVWTCVLLIAFWLMITAVTGAQERPIFVPIVAVAVRAVRAGVPVQGAGVVIDVAPRQRPYGYTDINGVYVAFVVRTAEVADVVVCVTVCSFASVKLPDHAWGVVFVEVETDSGGSRP